MSDTTFDAAKNYKKVCYRADRDLLNTELNEAQDIEVHERRILLDKILAQGTIILGLGGTVDADEVTIADGAVYLDGCAVNVPGTSLSFPTPGEHLIYLDVFRREVTASDDPSLVNLLTGEPTAEREKWIATLQTRDTSNDPLPDGAISRTVAPVYIFNRDTGELRPYVGSSLSGGDIFSAFADHAGHGGLDRHPAVTSESAGFMTPDQAASLESVEAALPNKADVSALNAHKTSADHDARYYTESESDTRFAPVGHVGSGGNAHAASTISQGGFMSATDKTQLGDHESRLDSVEATLPGKADDADITALQNSLNTHKSSADHDSRYYTESESDGRFAPVAHVGSAGSAHGLATNSQAGFMPKEISRLLSGIIHWTCWYDYGNDGIGTLPNNVISGPSGTIWRGKCDSNSSHRLYAMLRATGTPITAVFELYHLTGTVTMETGGRVQLADPAYHPSTVPGSKIYYVQLYPDSFTSFSILVSGSGEVGFSLSIFPGDDRQICYEVDPERAGKPIA